ncbi:sodium/glucose cotransporter 5-like isoform X1 [Aplysia californica]|uniref:Sodium/glucose cotransporter 5-like isoform X1 n=2 Tax=Aplysia californica TaxID=6500 RepID=A0ABM1W4A1_APLCA|nr:sodium/glucose cotransporter 5-like isoform X1 [Aplysia californica]
MSESIGGVFILIMIMGESVGGAFILMFMDESVVGYFILMIMGFNKVGGYEELQHRYMSAYPNTTLAHMNDENYSYTDCGIPPSNSYNLIRPADDGDLPWPGVFIGLTISSVWYWCSDQVSGRGMSL